MRAPTRLHALWIACLALMLAVPGLSFDTGDLRPFDSSLITPVRSPHLAPLTKEPGKPHVGKLQLAVTIDAIRLQNPWPASDYKIAGKRASATAGFTTSQPTRAP